MTNTTPFVIASTTKTVTATMVMPLVQRHTKDLSLTTPLADYYPDFGNATKVRLEMLLANKSGLPDYNIEAEVMADPRRAWTRQHVLDTIDQAQTKPPGTSEY